MKRHVVHLVVISLTLACASETLTSPDGLPSARAVAGSSSCYTVSGTIQQTGLPGSFSGSITGDVVGTVTTVTQGTASHGAVNFGMAQQTWEVTGGIIEELIGTTVQLELRTMTVNAQPGAPQLNNSADIIEGATKGNLTYHGSLDVSSIPFAATVEYSGVICP
jgi:hypothetical protein